MNIFSKFLSILLASLTLVAAVAIFGSTLANSDPQLLRKVKCRIFKQTNTCTEKVAEQKTPAADY
ncbi:MAG: hypothetical protein KDD42_00120 [Bdellovibrionales bacterium]|nr:hypothetical protein [Bdellovibrionales bacterium]